jgi:hypothetical protein
MARATPYRDRAGIHSIDHFALEVPDLKIFLTNTEELAGPRSAKLPEREITYNRLGGQQLIITKPDDKSRERPGFRVRVERHNEVT